MRKLFHNFEHFFLGYGIKGTVVKTMDEYSVDQYG